MRPEVKFWGSLALLVLVELAYVWAYLRYLPWDTHLFYSLGVVLLGFWLLYATSLVVRGPLAAAPGLCAFCLVLFIGFLRFDVVNWQVAIIFLGIAAAYMALVVRGRGT